MREPTRLTKGKRFHTAVQQVWQHDATGIVAIESSIIKPSGRRGRVDILVTCADEVLVGIVYKEHDRLASFDA